MKGVIEYMVEAPSTWEVIGNLFPRPLVFCPFKMASRPAAWKNQGSDENLYRNVQEALPLWGNGNFAQRIVPSPTVHIEGTTTGKVKPMAKRRVRVKIISPVSEADSISDQSTRQTPSQQLGMVAGKIRRTLAAPGLPKRSPAVTTNISSGSETIPGSGNHSRHG
jgi:hypothetical protein